MNILKVKSYSETFSGNVLLTVGANVVIGLVGIITGTMAARLLGVQGRGELAAIQAWPTFIAWVAALGFPEAVVYFTASERSEAGRYLGTGVAFVLLMSCFFVLAGYFVMPFLMASQSPQVVEEARWYLAIVPLYSLGLLPLFALRGRNDMAWNTLRVTPAIGWLVVLVLAYLFRPTPGFAAAGYLVMAFCYALLIAFVLLRRVKGSFWPQARKIKALWTYGLPSMFSTIPQLLNFRLDQMLMVAFLPARLLGLYAVGVAWATVGSFVLSGIGMALFPRIASIRDPEERIRAFAQGSRMGAIFSVLTASVLALLAPLLLPLLFGADFAPAISAAVMLSVAAGVAGQNMILQEGLRGLGKPKSVMWSEIIGLLVTMASLAVLLKPMGILGAAISSFFGYSTVNVVLMVQGMRVTGCSLGKLILANNGDFTMIQENVQAIFQRRHSPVLTS